MVRYMVTYRTKHGGTGVINTFRTKVLAEKQVRVALKSKSFRKLGYSNPRIRRIK